MAKKIILLYGGAETKELNVYWESNKNMKWDKMLTIKKFNEKIKHIYVKTLKNGMVQVAYTDDKDRVISQVTGPKTWIPKSLEDERREDVDLIVGDKLTYYRSTKELTRDQLAKLSGVSVQSITRFENGERNLNKASLETVSKLAKALQIKTDDLIDAYYPKR